MINFLKVHSKLTYKESKLFCKQLASYQFVKPPPKQIDLVYRLCGGKEEYIKLKEAIQLEYLKILKEYPELEVCVDEKCITEDKEVITKIEAVKLKEVLSPKKVIKL